MTTTPVGASLSIPRGRATRLRAYNLALGSLHALQGVLVLALSTDFSLPVTGSFLAGPPGTSPTAPVELFQVSVGPAVAAFLFLSAAAHWLIASPAYFSTYLRQLTESRNYARWVEYAASSTLMVLLIAMLPGILDASALIGLAAANVAMILFGLLMERYETPGQAYFLPFWFGSLAGIAPWLAIAVYLVSPGSTAQPPGFVYGIFGSLFVFFNIFALNMYLQYKRIGPWRDYLFGESVYAMLSLTAKSALAWQVFAGTLA